MRMLRCVSSRRAAARMTIVAVAVIATTAFCGCSDSLQWRQSSGAVWNTVYNITYSADRDLSDSVMRVFRDVELSLSPFNENSLVSKINRNETSQTDTLFRRVFDISTDICRRSGGKFDPTISPAVNLWKFGFTGKVNTADSWEPSAAEIDSVMSFVGILDCRIDSAGVLYKKHRQTTFNFSAVTKGYACDMIVAMLRRNGVESAMVEIGGEVAVIGRSPRGGKWRLQIDTPTEVEADRPEHNRLEVLEVTDCGVATSGNYRNFHESSQGRVGHTIDPLTGQPAIGRILSVTVVSPTCGEADAWATAAMASPTVEFADSILSCAGLRAIIVIPSAESADGLEVIHLPR